MKTAIVIGATGMVGSQLVHMLLNDRRFDTIKTLVRKSANINSPKLEEHIVDFDNPDSWKKLLKGDVLYSAMGTTRKAAGGKEGQYKIDYTFQYLVAKIAATNNVPRYVLISSAGARADSKFFYTRMKGELERDVQKLPFETIHIIRPGMLAGERNEARTGEQMGIGIMNIVSKIPGLKSLQPIQDTEVAKAMINATFKPPVGIHRYSMGGVFKLAKAV